MSNTPLARPQHRLVALMLAIQIGSSSAASRALVSKVIARIVGTEKLVPLAGLASSVISVVVIKSAIVVNPRRR